MEDKETRGSGFGNDPGASSKPIWPDPSVYKNTGFSVGVRGSGIADNGAGDVGPSEGLGEGVVRHTGAGSNYDRDFAGGQLGTDANTI